MTKKFLGLQSLETLTSYKNNNPKTALLKKYYPEIAEPFEYFLKHLDIFKKNAKNHDQKNCPDPTKIIASILENAVNRPNENWEQHQEDCYLCKNLYSTYEYLIDNLLKVLNNSRQETLSNIVLAYLRNDPVEEINKKIKVLSNHQQIDQIDPLFKIPIIKGILVVKKINPNTREVISYRYGLVRKKFHLADGTICTLYSTNDIDLLFSIELTDQLNQFYFRLLDNFEINGGLRFYFGPKDKLIKHPNGFFAQHVQANIPALNPNWEAMFYGTIC